MTSRTRSARIWLPATIALTALVLTGCSSSSKGTSAEIEEGPLDKYLSVLWDGEEYTQEKLDKDQLKIEELVAECMTKEGFEYKPNTQSGGVVISSEDEQDGPVWGSEEFVKEYGYGIVNWPGMNDQTEDPSEEWVDPNQDYVESLSESEQQAYYETLHGTGPTEEQMAEMEESGSYQSDWTQEGCYGAAQHEVNGDMAAAYEDPEFADLFAAMNEMYSGMWDEENPAPEIEKLNAKWSDCMAEAGYPDLTSPMTAQNSMNEEYYGLGGSTDEEYKEPSKKQKDEFQKREIEMATADLSCKKKVDFEKTEQKIMFDAQQKFVDEHKSELEALTSKHSTKTKD